MRTKPLYNLRTPDQVLLMRQKRSAAAKPPFSRRLNRSIDRMITACQEWLECQDMPVAKLAAIAVLIIFAVYAAAHLVFKICRGS